MTPAVPTRAQIAAQVDAVLAREPDARYIAIRSPARESWPAAIALRNRSFALRWCDSPLAVRELLTDEAPRDGVVLLTNLGERDLGADVIARLSRARIFQIESWDIVRQMFQAREIDSRLASQGWMTGLLLENAPPTGYPPVPGGFLDLDTAWNHALAATLRLGGGRPDVLALLRWTMAADNVSRYTMLPESAQPHVLKWIADSAGPAGELVMRCVAAGNGTDALPLGLVCAVAFAEDAASNVERAAAVVRMERLTGNRPVGNEEGRRWAQAAAWVVRNAGPEVARPFLDRGDNLLHEFHLTGCAGISDLLPSGFEARLAVFAAALTSFLREGGAEPLAEVEKAAESVLAHELANASPTRGERVAMARRLCRWLAGGGAAAAGFGALALGYAREGAFVDWARFKLLGGDELAALSAAYGKLGDAVGERRETLNRSFAEALKNWNVEGSVAAGCVPVERILDHTLGPLARQADVLLLVLDGLSYSIFSELRGDLERLGWIEAIPHDATGPAVGIAALPTVTEISRASLLCGQLTSGAASVEKAGFGAHPALLAASRAAGKPIVFHKGDLGEASGLAEQVRQAIGTAERRVVAIEYNAVDDHLSGSDQLHLRWSLDDLRLLKPILHEARGAGRALVITADHGHVIEERTTQRAAAEADRWRTRTGMLEAGEIVLDGGRVRAPSGGASVICAWSERLRYSAKKNGYHGGVSPQEVVVPLGVFLPPRVQLEHWKPAAPVQPEWWQDAAAAAKPARMPARPPEARRKKPAAAGQGELFAAAAAGPGPDWVAALFATTTYQQQKQLAARVAPQDEDMRRLLEALDGRGGKLSKAALGQRLGMPLVRVSGFVSAARRILNVDQAAVLALDETGATVELNRELLDVQFQLKSR